MTTPGLPAHPRRPQRRACPPGRPPTRPGPPCPSTRCCPSSSSSGAATGRTSCAPTAGRPGSTAASGRRTAGPARRRTARSPAPPTRARCWPAPTRPWPATGRAVEELAGGGLDGEAFRRPHAGTADRRGRRRRVGVAVRRPARSAGCTRRDPAEHLRGTDPDGPPGRTGRPDRSAARDRRRPTQVVAPGRRIGRPTGDDRAVLWTRPPRAALRTASAGRSPSYRIEQEIGRGGMAVVYRARDLRLDRTVALKLLAPELARNDTFRQPLHP